MTSSRTGTWSPVALSTDLSAASVIPATVPAGGIAVWRSQSGQLSAVAERCPHRGMRLSHGFVRGETLSCIYHGWRYGQKGNCVRIPAHPGLTPPDTIRVENFAAEEADGIVWVASGEISGPPPRLEGLEPLRSLMVEADSATVEAAVGARADLRGVIDAGNAYPGLYLLLSSQSEERTLLHVLVASVSDPAARIAASRHAEALRRAAEALHRSKVAA